MKGKNKPMLSIIIPVYNVENYIRECLDSIFSQNFEACEVICVNDGSTDSSLNILYEYRSLYPNYLTILSQDNQGQAVARNAALDCATGEYVAFLDSDDYYMSHAIDTILGLIMRYPTADVIYTDCAQTTSGNRFYTLHYDTPIEKDLIDFYDWEFEQYATTPVGCVCGGIYKLEFLNKYDLRMYPGVYYEDELYIFNVYTKQGSVVAMHLQEPYYYYRLGRDGSTISSLKLKNFKDRLTVIRKMHSILDSSTHVTTARRHKLFEMYLQNMIESYQHGYIREVERMLCREDILVMEAGTLSSHEKKLLRLLHIHPILMVVYKTNQLPNFIRRCINRFIK